MLFSTSAFFFSVGKNNLTLTFPPSLLYWLFMKSVTTTNNLHTRNTPKKNSISHLCPYTKTQEICNDTNLTFESTSRKWSEIDNYSQGKALPGKETGLHPILSMLSLPPNSLSLSWISQMAMLIKHSRSWDRHCCNDISVQQPLLILRFSHRVTWVPSEDFLL